MQYLVFGTSDNSQSEDSQGGIVIDYWPGIARYLYRFFSVKCTILLFLEIEIFVKQDIQQTAEITKTMVRQVTDIKRWLRGLFIWVT